MTGNGSGQQRAVVRGVVVRGDGRGRELGFPTANIELDESFTMPDDGVYAGVVERANGRRFLAALSVGRRPTYYGDDGPRLLEAHLLDFEGDLYGEHVGVELGALVRGQLRLSSSEALVARIEADLAVVRELGEPPRTRGT